VLAPFIAAVRPATSAALSPVVAEVAAVLPLDPAATALPSGLPRLAGRGGPSGLPISNCPMLGRSLSSGPEWSGKMALNFALRRLYSCEVFARVFFSCSVVRMEPVVISSESMNESRPVRMVDTDHDGFQEPA